jgi:hypothetical protein
VVATGELTGQIIEHYILFASTSHCNTFLTSENCALGFGTVLILAGQQQFGSLVGVVDLLIGEDFMGNGLTVH